MMAGETAVIRTLLFLIIIAPALAGCTVNPATGGRSFTGFMSPEDETRVGREQHPQIVRAFGGAYGDRRVQDYVARVGQSLAQVSELPTLGFTFTVLDSPVVNAFALPGGYIYVTRGLMALASDEAELAGVLAHEIGHTTARHAAQRYSQQIVAGLGAAVAGAITGSDEIADSVSFSASSVLQSYSRDQEFEADTLAIRYLGRTGYALEAISAFLAKVDRHTRLEAENAGRSPGEIDSSSIAATHPRTLDRVERTAASTGTVQGRRERAAYLGIIDGMLYGDDPDQGQIRGQTFIHPRLAIRFDVPPGFRLMSGTRQVVAQNASGAAIAFDTARADQISMADYLGNVWGKSLRLADIERIQINGQDAASASARIQVRRGPMDLRLVAIRVEATIHRFLFLIPPQLSETLSEELHRTLFSFRRLSAAEAVAAPRRIRLHTVQPGESKSRLIQMMAPDAARERRFDIINGLGESASPPPGSLVKVVTE